MVHRRLLMLIIAATTLFAPLMVLSDTYQFIITPGYDPAVYSTNDCSIVSSTSSSLTTGTLSLPAVKLSVN